MRRLRRKTIIIAGPPQSGKSALFYRVCPYQVYFYPEPPCVVQLTGKELGLQIPSLRPDKELIKVGRGWGRYAKLVDLPGDPRLSNYMEDAVKKADLIIFVVDGAAFLEHIRDAAQKLWTILGDPVIQKQDTIPVMIAVNKWDLGAKVHTGKFIVHRLESEIEELRVPQSSRSMGEEYKPFSFEAVTAEVAVAAVSTKMNEIEPVRAFLKRHLEELPNAY